MRTIGKETLATGMRVIVSAHLFSMLAILTNACGTIVHADSGLDNNNLNMEAVCKMNQLVQSYFPRETLKWFRKLAIHSIQTSSLC